MSKKSAVCKCIKFDDSDAMGFYGVWRFEKTGVFGNVKSQNECFIDINLRAKSYKCKSRPDIKNESSGDTVQELPLL